MNKILTVVVATCFSLARAYEVFFKVCVELDSPVGQKAKFFISLKSVALVQMDVGDNAIGLHMVLSRMWGKTFPTDFGARER